MQLIAIGDLHIRDKTPRSRTDANYLDTIFDKLICVFNQADKIAADIIIPGDLFDSYRASDRSKKRFMEFLQNRQTVVYAVAGQHDMRFHNSDLDNTPIGVVSTIENYFCLLGDDVEPNIEDWDIYGVHWGDGIPPMTNKKFNNILVIHKMISDFDYWNGHVQYSGAQAFLREHKNYQLIISGDNHKTFVVKEDGRYLINPGSLMRSSIDQYDHKPCYFEIDLDKEITVKQHFIPVRSANEVFRWEEIKKEKEVNEALTKYADSLAQTSISGSFDFEREIIEYIRTHEISNEVKAIIMEAMGEAK